MKEYTKKTSPATNQTQEKQRTTPTHLPAFHDPPSRLGLSKSGPLRKAKR